MFFMNSYYYCQNLFYINLHKKDRSLLWLPRNFPTNYRCYALSKAIKFWTDKFVMLSQSSLLCLNVREVNTGPRLLDTAASYYYYYFGQGRQHRLHGKTQTD